MAPRRLLLTGATGYIGGSMLSMLLSSKHDSIKNLEISALVRGEDKAKILADQGVNPILFKDLDDVEVIRRAASEHDVVMNTASGFHTANAKALIEGLGQRRKSTGEEVYFFHTTGTSNIADKPITKEYREVRILSDRDDIYSYLKARESKEVYVQRTTDIVAIETGLEQNVKTYLIMSPTIYGTGSGLFNRRSMQLPTIIRSALKAGQMSVVGDGSGVWDAVHIEDLVLLYEILLAKVLAGESVPSGKEGIFFSETGDFTWLQLAEGLAYEMHKQGLIKTPDVKSMSLQQAAELLGGNAQHAELGLASNSRSRAELSRELSWNPKKGRADFAKSFADEVKIVAVEAKK